jgi:hypothetical protein
MRHLFTSRRLAALALLTLVALGTAGWSVAGRRDDGRGSSPVPTAGPVVALYVVDHHGAAPEAATFAPYRNAFRRVLGRCSITATDLASVVFHMSDRASMGSGTNIDNLEVLRGLVANVPATRGDCNWAFWVTEARLKGAALG